MFAVRPEVILIRDRSESVADAGLDVTAEGRVVNRIYLGEQTEYSVETKELGKILVRAAKTHEAGGGGLDVGDAVVVGWRRDAALALRDD